MTVTHPVTGVKRTIGNPGLGTLILGPFYWMFHGAFGPALVYLIAAIFTAGLAHLVVPFFASRILTMFFENKGWKAEGRSAAWAVGGHGP